MMRTRFHSGTHDLLALKYEPVATLPGLVVARYRATPDLASRHWLSLSSVSRHRCGAAGAMSERAEFLLTTALSKASFWCHAGHWRAPRISVSIDASELCEHSSLPRLLCRTMATSQVSGRHLTIELGGCSAERFDAVATTLRRLHEIGVRLSYEPAKAAAAFHDFAFDETRYEFGTSPAAAQLLLDNATGTTAPVSRRLVLAAGVATGDHLMAALSAGATHVDGTFAGTVRCDRSNFGEPSRVDDTFAYL